MSTHLKGAPEGRPLDVFYILLPLPPFVFYFLCSVFYVLNSASLYFFPFKKVRSGLATNIDE